MTTEKSLIDSAIRGWKSNVERADKLFGGLSSEQLEQEVGPGRNRLIYLWGHLAAANDGLLPLLGIGERLHIHSSARKNRAPRLSRGAGDLGAAKDIVGRFGIRIAIFRQSLK
jgi:hypothetical protein